MVASVVVCLGVNSLKRNRRADKCSADRCGQRFAPLGAGGGSNAGHPKGRPRSGCSDDPLRSLTSRSLAKALRGNAPRGLAPPMLSRGMLPRNIGCRLGAPWHSPLRPSWGSIRFMSPKAKRPCLRHRIPKMIRSGQEREQRTLPVFHPVSSLLFAFAEIS